MLPPAPGRRQPGALDGDGGAGALEGGLGLLRGVLVDLLQDRLGGAVHEVLGLLQTEGREGAHLLDDLDLLVADRVEDDVELVLLLLDGGGLAATGAGSGRAGDRDGRGGLDVEGLLEGLHELRELDERELLESVEQLVGAELRHEWRPFVCTHGATRPRAAGRVCQPSVGWSDVCSAAGSCAAGSSPVASVPDAAGAALSCLSRSASMVRAAWVSGALKR